MANTEKFYSSRSSIFNLNGYPIDALDRAYKSTSDFEEFITNLGIPNVVEGTEIRVLDENDVFSKLVYLNGSWYKVAGVGEGTNDKDIEITEYDDDPNYLKVTVNSEDYLIDAIAKLVPTTSISVEASSTTLPATATVTISANPFKSENSKISYIYGSKDAEDNWAYTGEWSTYTSSLTLASPTTTYSLDYRIKAKAKYYLWEGEEKETEVITTYRHLNAPTEIVVGDTKYDSSRTITINYTSQDDAEKVYYTLDGSTPTTSSTKYSAPFSVDSELSAGKIVAKAFAKDAENSDLWVPSGEVKNTVATTVNSPKTYYGSSTLTNITEPSQITSLTAVKADGWGKNAKYTFQGSTTEDKYFWFCCPTELTEATLKNLSTYEGGAKQDTTNTNPGFKFMKKVSNWYCYRTEEALMYETTIIN